MPFTISNLIETYDDHTAHVRVQYPITPFSGTLIFHRSQTKPFNKDLLLLSILGGLNPWCFSIHNLLGFMMKSDCWHKKLPQKVMEYYHTILFNIHHIDNYRWLQHSFTIYSWGVESPDVFPWWNLIAGWKQHRWLFIADGRWWPRDVMWCNHHRLGAPPLGGHSRPHFSGSWNMIIYPDNYGTWP